MNGSIAIVGAGISGLTAARELRRAGFTVTVFERGRGPGGRSARRRVDQWSFDHGAQYFTARDERFRSEVVRWLENGTAARWDPRMAVVADGTLTPKSSRTERYVGTPGMNALARDLAGDIPVRTGAIVTAVERPSAGAERRWIVRVAGGTGSDTAGASGTTTFGAGANADTTTTDEGPFDAVILAAPPPQWLPLLPQTTSFHAAARSVTFLPTWAAMIGLADPLPIEADGLFIHDPVLSWAARNSSKPGRDTPPAWVLHSNPAWAAGREEMAPEEILPQMIDAFQRATGVVIGPTVYAAAHRWRYSRAEPALGVTAFWDGELGIGACGDWCAGSRVEGAYLSGVAVAERVTER